MLKTNCGDEAISFELDGKGDHTTIVPFTLLCEDGYLHFGHSLCFKVLAIDGDERDCLLSSWGSLHLFMQEATGVHGF